MAFDGNITALIETIRFKQKEQEYFNNNSSSEVLSNDNYNGTKDPLNYTHFLELLENQKRFFNENINLTEIMITTTHTPTVLDSLVTLLTNSINDQPYEIENNSFSDSTSGVGQEIIGMTPMVRFAFYIFYALICIIGLVGNSLVLYAVVRTPTMHNVTNVFIANLAIADILLCIFAVPITPIYLIAYKSWIFGPVFCRLLPFAQGVSVYISAFTLMSIAIDRYFVILHPFRPRMVMKTCLWIIVAIWISTCILTAPLAHFMKLSLFTYDDDYVGNRTVMVCDEIWPSDYSKKTFGFSTSILQFVIPFIIITFCYTLVCRRLSDRAKTIPGSVSVRREEQERERARKTNAMLISMVIIFVFSWLPFNIYNLIVDFFGEISFEAIHSQVIFHIVHATAMSSTCYNPFLYAWLNENFRKEFKSILPCFSRLGQRHLSFSVPNRRRNGSVPGTACHVKVKVTENNVQ